MNNVAVHLLALDVLLHTMHPYITLHAVLYLIDLGSTLQQQFNNFKVIVLAKYRVVICYGKM